MKFCSNCVMPDTKPGIWLDDRGFCNACRSKEIKNKIDWDARYKDLEVIVEEIKKAEHPFYDCVVPVSGGKDSTRQAFFVKDVIGPKGSVSIVSDDDTFIKDSDNLENHTKNNCLKIHSSELDSNQKFIAPNRKIVYDEDPSHQDLCDYEQEYFYNSIIDDVDLKSHMEDAYKSLQIALACDEAVKKSITVYLD